MSDWLERELARGLTRVNAPDALGEKLGLVRPPTRSEFRGALAAVAAAVMVIVGGGYAAGQSTKLDLYRFTERDLAAVRPIELASASISRVSWNVRDGAGVPLRCDGGAAGRTVRPATMTALLAHHGASEDRVQTTSDAGCGFCHSL